MKHKPQNSVSKSHKNLSEKKKKLLSDVYGAFATLLPLFSKTHQSSITTTVATL